MPIPDPIHILICFTQFAMYFLNSIIASIIISITSVLKIWPTISASTLINHHITNIDRPLMHQIDQMCYCKAGFHIKHYYIYYPWHQHICTATDRSFLEHINTAKIFFVKQKVPKKIY